MGRESRLVTRLRPHRDRDLFYLTFSWAYRGPITNAPCGGWGMWVPWFTQGGAHKLTYNITTSRQSIPIRALRYTGPFHWITASSYWHCSCVAVIHRARNCTIGAEGDLGLGANADVWCPHGRCRNGLGIGCCDICWAIWYCPPREKKCLCCLCIPLLVCWLHLHCFVKCPDPTLQGICILLYTVF